MSRLILSPLTFAIFVLGIAQPKHANPRIYLGRFLLLTISILHVLRPALEQLLAELVANPGSEGLRRLLAVRFEHL